MLEGVVSAEKVVFTGGIRPTFYGSDLVRPTQTVGAWTPSLCSSFKGNPHLPATLAVVADAGPLGTKEIVDRGPSD